MQIKAFKCLLVTAVIGCTGKNSSCIWTNVLRCSCGSSFRRNVYHKNKDEKTFCFICYNQVRFGKASARAKAGADTEGYCNTPCITEWKMDMMADNFIDQIWKSRKDDLLSLADEITTYYKEDAKKNNENNLLFIDSQIEKLKKKTKNLLEIYTDGEISKAEYSETRKTYDEEVKALEEQKINLTEQTEHYSRSMEDLLDITKALGEITDFSDKDTRNKFLQKILVSVVPENDRFYWNYRLNGQNETSCEYSVTGNKKNPTIILGNPEEASDEDASDIHNNEDVFYFNTESGCDQKSTPHKEQLHRLLSLLSRSHKVTISWEFPITYEMAKAYKKAHGSYLRKNQWRDIKMVFCLEVG